MLLLTTWVLLALAEPHAHDRISPASSLSSPLSDRSVPFEFSPDPKVRGAWLNFDWLLRGFVVLTALLCKQAGGVVPKLALNSKAMTSGDIQVRG